MKIKKSGDPVTDAMIKYQVTHPIGSKTFKERFWRLFRKKEFCIGYLCKKCPPFLKPMADCKYYGGYGLCRDSKAKEPVKKPDDN
jgi:hypothetical protein